VHRDGEPSSSAAVRSDGEAYPLAVGQRRRRVREPVMMLFGDARDRAEDIVKAL
jgi:hypothetical protein